MTAEGEGRRPTRSTYLLLAGLGAALSLLSIWPLWWLLHSALPLWLHVPLTAANLGVLALTAFGAGAAVWHGQFTGPQ